MSRENSIDFRLLVVKFALVGFFLVVTGMFYALLGYHRTVINMTGVAAFAAATLYVLTAIVIDLMSLVRGGLQRTILTRERAAD